MTSSGVLWPMALGFVAVVFAPTLLWLTTRLELLIASPDIDHRALARQRANVRMNRKER